MSSFVLKIIALISMFIDHLGYTLYQKFSNFNYIGRIAFPIFAFQISEGYKHTHSKKNYLINLLTFAIISQIPFTLFRSIFVNNSSSFSLNIFFTLLIGLIAIIGFEACKNKWIGLLLVFGLSSTANLLKMDYGYYGVLMIFLFHFFKEKKFLMNLSYCILVFLHYLPNIIISNFSYIYFILLFFTLLPIIFINMYNNEYGKNIKYFLYTFYPLHLIVLYLFNSLFI
ncbi:MAG: conjugal transfer protein TraX [Clostridia bacterium]|jgi:hypothetical protein|nr:conjugal transfer protein TraX [Clostridia bacterium]